MRQDNSFLPFAIDLIFSTRSFRSQSGSLRGDSDRHQLSRLGHQSESSSIPSLTRTSCTTMRPSPFDRSIDSSRPSHQPSVLPRIWTAVRPSKSSAQPEATNPALLRCSGVAHCERETRHHTPPKSSPTCTVRHLFGSRVRHFRIPEG